MTPNQKDILGKLVLGNLIVYMVLAFLAFGPSLPQRVDLMSGLPAVALQPTRTPSRPTSSPTSILARSATATLVIRPVLRNVRSPAPPVTSPAPLTAQAGGSPSDPMIATDSWQTLGAGGRVWYLIGSGGVHMDVFLEAKPPDGMTLEVYAPGQLDQPIGHGTFQAATGALVWAGGHWQSEGDWLACVINGNPVPVRYKLTSSAKDISGKSCYSYWENIGAQRVYWTKCQ
jgi:hypothetical protein